MRRWRRVWVWWLRRSVGLLSVRYRRCMRAPPPLPVRPTIPAPGSPRFDRLDALRGVAIVWMAAFHFSFDLNHFGFIRENFYTDPFWTVQRACIVTLFLFCAGLGQAIALHQGVGRPRFSSGFWRRWAQVAGCALLVSIGSWWVFPKSFISFGVLHGIALMLIIVRLTRRAGAWLWPLGLIAIVMPQVVAAPLFDHRYSNWVGLVTHKPITEDWVPVLPWLGVMWWGCAAGQWVLAQRRGWITGDVPSGLTMLARLGRWSLTIYLVHQPVLIGAIAAARRLHA